MPKIQIACEGSGFIHPRKLVSIQGDMKTLSKENFHRLKNAIVKFGFSEPVSVWESEGFYYILNGHQRVRTVLMMLSAGYECEGLPVSMVEAADIKEAKRKLLTMASQYGEFDHQGLYEFIEKSNLTESDLEDCHFPDLDLDIFIEGYYGDEIPDEPPDKQPKKDPKTCPGCGFRL